jgi:hydrogenase expression/formation protein HypD
MKFIDEFRDPAIASSLVRQIQSLASRPWVLMEVCGGQTHSLLRHGIDTELHGTVELIHGPGCPVCVTDISAIDRAQWLAFRPNIVLTSFGDMLRVPGSHGSLLTARAAGANVRTVYSPLDAVRYASSHPDQQIVFFAVGFETTAPATSLAVLQARELGLKNFTVLVSHVRVQPAMEALMQAPDNRVQGFLAAGHVCAITGYHSYEEFARRYRTPVVVTGFEPVDLLQGILECVGQLESGRAEVRNMYARSVNQPGNLNAQHIVNSVYEIDDRVWRGLGLVRGGGYRLRDEFAAFDAERRFADTETEGSDFGSACQFLPLAESELRCKAGEVLSGRMKPCDCGEFGTACTPDSPLGAPMVSSEGACAAWFRYHRT